jgi:hypothetical protein
VTRRWEDYVLVRGDEEVQAAWREAASPGPSVYVVGEGFDPRALHGLRRVLSGDGDVKVLSLALAPEGGTRSRRGEMAAENVEQLRALTERHGVALERIPFPDVHERRFLGRAHLRTLLDHSAFRESAHVTIDISALPTGVFFALIGGLLASVDRDLFGGELQVIVSENAEIDALIEGEGSETPAHIVGFRGEHDLEPTLERPTLVWAPVLGAGADAQLEALFQSLAPDEICPVLPFPARDPRRPDRLLLATRELIVDQLEVESRNYIHADERNPFDLYRALSGLQERYDAALEPLGGAVVAISIHSSKTLSLGALLAAHEHGLPVMNAEPEHYEFRQNELTPSLLDRSELVCAWLAGTPSAG